MKVAPDDEVYRADSRWFGPTGWTFPIAARYLGWAIFFAVCLLILLVEALTPIPVGTPPIWEVTLAAATSSIVMLFVDHERPVAAVIRTLMADLRAPRPAKPETVHVHAKYGITRTFPGSTSIYPRRIR